MRINREKRADHGRTLVIYTRAVGRSSLRFATTEECEKNAHPDNKIDLSDISEIKYFSDFPPLGMHDEFYKSMKEQVSIWFNKVLLAHFRSLGKGWQSRVNDFLMMS